jgi:hypothetical protein
VFCSGSRLLLMGIERTCPPISPIERNQNNHLSLLVKVDCDSQFN